ncbi:hypothetical protein [Delftia sp. PS-11]|uniref:hypothetical protein n=1 Tax=Delftia sp. PS-11 TaxID=2767222 RepID=UPI00245817EA|nr:hypothetical protein [Delftia sp. PS-11]KAJ8744841.1 hypothetical protein H9T68_10200 [Delftia sp. PS-11]
MSTTDGGVLRIEDFATGPERPMQRRSAYPGKDMPGTGEHLDRPSSGPSKVLLGKAAYAACPEGRKLALRIDDHSDTSAMACKIQPCPAESYSPSNARIATQSLQGAQVQKPFFLTGTLKARSLKSLRTPFLMLFI